MIEINFTQCAPGFEMDGRCAEWMRLPVIPRLAQYEQFLLHRASDDKECCWYMYTVDELLILVAQSFVRKGLISKENIRFRSHCTCRHISVVEMTIDDDGDFLEDMQHGFFHQRLDYLR